MLDSYYHKKVEKIKNDREAVLDRSGGVDDDESMNYEDLNIDERYAKMERHIRKGLLNIGKPASNYPSTNHTRNMRLKRELKGNVVGYELAMHEMNALLEHKKNIREMQRARALPSLGDSRFSKSVDQMERSQEQENKSVRSGFGSNRTKLVSQSLENIQDVEEIAFRNYNADDESISGRGFNAKNSLIAQKKLFPKLEKGNLSDSGFDKTETHFSIDANVVRDRQGNPIEFCIALPPITKKPQKMISLRAPPKNLETKLNYFDGLEGIER